MQHENTKKLFCWSCRLEWKAQENNYTFDSITSRDPYYKHYYKILSSAEFIVFLESAGFTSESRSLELVSLITWMWWSKQWHKKTKKNKFTTNAHFISMHTKYIPSIEDWRDDKTETNVGNIACIVINNLVELIETIF